MVIPDNLFINIGVKRLRSNREEAEISLQFDGEDVPPATKYLIDRRYKGLLYDHEFGRKIYIGTSGLINELDIDWPAQVFTEKGLPQFFTICAWLFEMQRDWFFEGQNSQYVQQIVLPNLFKYKPDGTSTLYKVDAHNDTNILIWLHNLRHQQGYRDYPTVSPVVLNPLPIVCFDSFFWVDRLTGDRDPNHKSLPFQQFLAIATGLNDSQFLTSSTAELSTR